MGIGLRQTMRGSLFRSMRDLAAEDDSAPSSPGGGYSAEATALFARMDVQPSSTILDAIDAFIVGANADGFWSDLDTFIIGLNTARNSKLDWLNTAPGYLEEKGGTVSNPGTVDSDSDKINWTQWIGFNLVDATAGVYLDLGHGLTGFTGAKATTTDITVGIYIQTYVYKAYQGFLGTSTFQFALGSPNSGRNIGAMINSNSVWPAVTLANDAAGKGLWTGRRTGNTVDICKNGVSQASATATTTTSDTNSNCRVFSGNAIDPPDPGCKLTVIHSGRYLNDTKMAALNSRLTTLLTATGGL